MLLTPGVSTLGCGSASNHDMHPTKSHQQALSVTELCGMTDVSTWSGSIGCWRCSASSAATAEDRHGSPSTQLELLDCRLGLKKCSRSSLTLNTIYTVNNLREAMNPVLSLPVVFVFRGQPDSLTACQPVTSDDLTNTGKSQHSTAPAGHSKPSSQDQQEYLNRTVAAVLPCCPDLQAVKHFTSLCTHSHTTSATASADLTCAVRACALNTTTDPKEHQVIQHDLVSRHAHH